ncbi:hypothetical protein CCAX7_004250 [Capsulimonas corticalis]|uniref:Uncharacterized protein n=2 Tax=Capsulimonas corticalis TaxID=2219043 RepID=A0A402D2W7_9BACT|nr:hypothetical protein CCAX7_004250 [Capsulimonas corticalis]
MEQMPPAIDFTVWNSPAFSEEWEGQASKGYANFKTPPPNLLPSLDNVPHGGDKDFKAYRHVEGNWYLFFFYKPP